MAKQKKPPNRVPIRLFILISFYILGFCATCYIFNLIENLPMQELLTGDITKYLFKPWYLYRIPQKLDPFMVYTLPALLGFYMVYRSEQKYEAKHSQEGLHGKSRFSDEKEIKEELYAIPEKKLDSAEKSGIPLAYIDGVYYVDVTTTHSLVIGTTRSGKTQTYVLPFIKLLASCQHIESKQSMVINDPKGEILENTYKILKDNGYKVVVLNLRDTTKTSRWNPLSFIIKEYVYAKENDTDMSKVNDYIDTLANTLTYNPNTDPIWPSSAKSLLKAMILYLIDTAYENDCLDKVNMYSVYQFFIEYGGADEEIIVNNVQKTVNKLDTLFKNLPVGSPAKAAYATSKFAQGDMRSSIFATLSDNIDIFGTDEGIAALTSGSDIIFEDLVDNEQPTAIFMVVPDDRPTRHIIASMFVNQCYTSMVEYLSKNKMQSLPRRVNFILDEFASMPRIPGMDNKMTVSAGRNMLFHLFIQDLSQLDLRYKDEAKVIRNSCGNFIYIYSIEPDTNEFVSKMLGNETKEFIAYSGSLKEFISQTSYQAIGKPLIAADELSVLEYGETIIKRQRMYPIRSTFKFFYKSNPVITPIDNIITTKNISKKEEWLFDFKIIDEKLNPKPNIPSSDGIPSASFYNPPPRKPNMPRNTSNEKVNPMKLALELADEASNHEFQTLITKGQFKQCQTWLNRFKISKALDERSLELLTNYINGFVNQ